MEIRLNGRVALITGGSRGLGRAMAIKFAQAGADVAIAARRPEELEATRAEIEAVSKGRVMAVPCDVADQQGSEEMFHKVAAEMGRVDILVNNAGRSAAAPIEEITDAAWREDFELKLFSSARLCRLAFPGMKSRQWGRVINVLNAQAKAPGAGMGPTAVSRAAGMALTKVLAGEGAPHNVLVNALCTGLIKSDQWKGFHERDAPDMPFDEFTAKVGKKVPLGRMGEAEEFANIACFLVSDAGSYITGTAINVDGGLSPVV